MAVFGGLMLTNSGRNLEAKITAGKLLKLKRIALGDGKLSSSESIVTLNKLKNEVLSQDIIGIKVVQDNIVKVTFQLTNTNLETGFNWREIGIIAEDPDTQTEVLFVYGNAGDNGEYISPGGETDILEKYINIDLIVSNIENVTAIIDESLVYATQKDMENLKENMEKAIQGQAEVVTVGEAIPANTEYEMPFSYIVGSNELEVKYMRLAVHKRH